jgi:hypothetical protein
MLFREFSILYNPRLLHLCIRITAKLFRLIFLTHRDIDFYFERHIKDKTLFHRAMIF